VANIKFRNVGIKAVSACVPKRIEKIDSLTEIFSRDEAEKFSRTTGIYERRIADENICTSDLCFAAAKKLMEENGISANSVDVLLFMSKTPDFITPSTSALLQSRLGLSKKTLCMDLRLDCSGYVYALSAAYAYASMDGVNRVLLLTGDVNSKIVSRKSRAECPVFGDGGSATLVEKGDFADSFFDFGTDGSRGDFIVIPCENGGRNRVAENSLQNKTDDDGNERNSLQDAYERNGRIWFCNFHSSEEYLIRFEFCRKRNFLC
jgi:3-oxoacyl-[acyl-carrier-protein] synthase-3